LTARYTDPVNDAVPTATTAAAEAGSRARSAYAEDFQTVLLFALRIADVAIVVVAGVLAYWLRHNATAPPTAPYLVAIAISGLLAANYFHLARIYTVSALRRSLAGYGALAAAWVAVWITLVLFAYLTKSSDDFSRIWFVLWFVLVAISTLVLRVAIADQVRTWTREGKLARNIVIVGAGEHGQLLVARLKHGPDPALRLVGVFDERATRIPREIEGYPVRGTIDDLLAFARTQRIDEIVIALPWRASAHMRALLTRLKTIPADVRLAPEFIDIDMPSSGFSALAGVPMLNVFERPLTGWGNVLKAIEDKALGATLLAAALPLCLLIALAIKLGSPGPALFRQTRYGFNNNEFTVFKFRTMRVNAQEDASVPQATRGDARVTRVGAFLRRTSLDELPQLYNVLRGDMSLVGPRPHAVPHNQQYAALIGDYLSRHRVKPGITGWAQVNGLRGEIASPEIMKLRVQHDIHYIEHWSLLLDIKILLLTMLFGFVNKNAY
jgi:putative colanic acid biosynthesis UDP-glucose lipid carrier transferase